MEDRLVQLLKAEGINPTRFAERIGVQRSSMSHIISGRNKPSFDFIVKILDSFPSVNPDWLLRGKGYMYKNDIPVQPSLFDVLKPVSKEEPKAISSEKIHPITNMEDEAVHSKMQQISAIAGNEAKFREMTQDKKIEKIVILYSDKTFSDYLPNS